MTIMNVLKVQIVRNVNSLIEEYSKLMGLLQVSNLSEETQKLYKSKLLAIGYIMSVLLSFKQLSPKINKLLHKSLTDERCTSAEANEFNFRHVNHMRYVVNELRGLLVNTILNTDDINQLLETNSITEVEKIYENIKGRFVGNKQLKSFIRRYQ